MIVRMMMTLMILMIEQNVGSICWRSRGILLDDL